MTPADHCIGADPACPCQDGDGCHYKDAADGTKAWPIPADCATNAPAQDLCSRLRVAGGLLANVAFNFAQKPGHTLTSDDVALLDKLRKQWDEALRGAR